MTNMAALIEQAAKRFGDREAVISGARRLTFEDVHMFASRLANELDKAGVSSGSKVALSCPNVPEFTIAYWAILKVGGVVVPLNVTLRSREIAYYLNDSDADVYLVYHADGGEALVDAAREGFEEAWRCRIFATLGESDGFPTWQGVPLVGNYPIPTADRGDDETAVIIYTSGTTGRPKGAELTHQNLRSNAIVAGAVYEISSERPDTFLLVAPLYHSLGQTCIQNAATVYGSTVVMQRRFDATHALQAMLEEGVTIFAGVPTMYWAMLSALDGAEHGSDLFGQLRVAASGGSAMPAEIHRDIERRLGVAVLEGYGLSETSPMACSARLGEPRRIGSIGRPIPGVEMKLINDDWSAVPEDPDVVGEIAIKGQNVMKGYYGRQDATDEAIRDGWFRTGDLASRDSDGFYFVVGRTKDLIIRGGYNVYPRELEELFMEHPAVSMVAVIGVPHPSHGQEIKAVVVKKDGHDQVTEELLRAWGRKRLAGYKYPRIVEFRISLPMTSTGKILKREIL